MRVVDSCPFATGTPIAMIAIEDGCCRVCVELWPTAYRFKRGHCLRVQVSSGAFPRFARNLGTGEPLATTLWDLVGTKLPTGLTRSPLQSRCAIRGYWEPGPLDRERTTPVILPASPRKDCFPDTHKYLMTSGDSTGGIPACSKVNYQE
jgi:hypothetical protein